MGDISSLIIGGRIQLPTSGPGRIGRIVQCVDCKVDIGAAVPRRRPASRNKSPDVVRKPFIGTRRTTRSIPGNDIVYNHAVLGPGEGLLPCDHLNAAVVAVPEIKQSSLT